MPHLVSDLMNANVFDDSVAEPATAAATSAALPNADASTRTRAVAASTLFPSRWSARLRALRRRSTAFVLDSTFLGLAYGGKVLPASWPQLHGIERIRNISYAGGTRGDVAHSLDIYRPRRASRPMPVVFYVHGGGFRVLSKDTHWVMGLIFARAGFLVFNINYRLAPAHPYPAALEDTFAAYRWLADHAAAYGGDLSRLVVAGESAGANLVAALSLATSYRRPEPWARPVWEMDLRPRVALPACGIHQVTHPQRFAGRPGISRLILDYIEMVSHAYVGDGSHLEQASLADPLVGLERAEPPHRPLPAFFLSVGTADPLLDDTRRMAAALQKLGVPHEARYYPGGLHAFHAMVWQRRARQCWRDTFRFVHRHLGAS